MMSSIIPLRIRLTAWYSLALALGLGLFAVLLWIMVDRYLDSSIDDALTDRVSNVRRYIRSETKEGHESRLEEELLEYAQALPEGHLMQVRGPQGRLLLGSELAAVSPMQPRPAADRAPVYGRMTYHGIRYRTISATVHADEEAYQVFAAASVELMEHILQRMTLLLFAAIPGVLLIASIGGYWLSRRALLPVDQMTTAARQIGVSNLSQRLQTPRPRDELQRLAETWNNMLDRLEAAFSRLSQFTADASHELRTPITLIRTTAELALRRERSGEAYRQALSQILSESETMSRLVEDLLTLARADSNDDLLPLSPLDLTALVSEVSLQGRTLAAAKELRFSFEIPAHPVIIAGHEATLRRMVLALLDNAVKYTPNGGSVRLHLETGAEDAIVVVADTGVGMSPAVLPHIFDRFYRADPARHRDAGGHGLGLSLAQWIARRHHAEITVESAPEQGSRFRVSIPLLRASFSSEDVAREFPDTSSVRKS